MTAGSVSCRREIVAAGTSNASTSTKGRLLATFFRPVTSIVNVWLVSARPTAVNRGTWTSLVFEYVSTSVTKLPSRKTRAMPSSTQRPPIQLTEVPVNVKVA